MLLPVKTNDMKKLIPVIATVFLFLSCNKQKLEGDYCVCKIDGKYWKAGCSDPYADCLAAPDWSNGKHGFVLDVTDGTKTLTIGVHDTTKILADGTYQLNEQSYYQGWFQDYNKSYSHYYRTDNVNTGTVTIHFDETNKRVSGTFSFKARYELSNEIINITNGQFSLPLEISN